MERHRGNAIPFSPTATPFPRSLSRIFIWIRRMDGSTVLSEKKRKKKKKKKKKKKRESDSRHLIKGDKGRRDD